MNRIVISRPDRAAPVAPAPGAVLRIAQLDGFDAVRPAWDALHARDADAGVFLSFGWLRALFAENPGDWVVVALRDPDDPARLMAALPLRRRLRWSRSRKMFQTHLSAAGRLCFSEYTGFLCDPAREGPGLDALAAVVAAMPWSDFALRYEPTTHRLQRFARALHAAGTFVVRFPDHRINRGETDQLICPQIVLPPDFDSYLQGQSRNTRKKIRKTMRRCFDSGEVQARLLEEVDYGAVKQALLDQWAARWADSNTPERLALVRGKYARMLDRARDLGRLYLPSLWQGDRCVGALGFVTDPDTRAYHCMVTGRDTGTDGLDLGLLMHAFAIRDVIGRGGRLYDFGHGTEAYKRHYATSAVALGNLAVMRQDGAVLDPAQAGAALARCERMLARGRTDDLHHALQQLRECADQPTAPGIGGR